jgi:hypothetical protein
MRMLKEATTMSALLRGGGVLSISVELCSAKMLKTCDLSNEPKRDVGLIER